MNGPGKNHHNEENNGPPGSKARRTYPDYFPGTVRHTFSIENRLFFCALSCVQKSVEMIPNAERLFDDVVQQLDTPGCRKVSEVINANVTTYARSVGRVAMLNLQKKRYSLTINRLVFLLKVLVLLPLLVFR